MVLRVKEGRFAMVRKFLLIVLLGVVLLTGVLLFGCLNQFVPQPNVTIPDGNHSYNNSRNLQQPPYIDPLVLSSFNSSNWVQVIVNLNYTDNTTLDNERLQVILYSLSPSEFMLRHRGTRGDWFSGNLSRNGFEKLRIMPFVSEIYSNKPAYAGETN